LERKQNCPNCRKELTIIHLPDWECHCNGSPIFPLVPLLILFLSGFFIGIHTPALFITRILLMIHAIMLHFVYWKMTHMCYDAQALLIISTIIVIISLVVYLDVYSLKEIDQAAFILDIIYSVYTNVLIIYNQRL